MKEQKDINQIIVIILVAIGLVIPVLWQTRNLSLRLDTDYDAHLPVYYFLIDTIRKTHALPSWNPYISTGIPVLGDPISSALNPFFVLPLVIFGLDTGFRVIFMIVILLSGMTMWVLLRSLGVAFWPRIWGASLYEVSGALSARIAAGHVEKFFSVPLQPLFLYCIIRRRITMTEIAIASVIIAVMILSGDIYSIWMITIIYGIARVYFWQKRCVTIWKDLLRFVLIYAGGLALSFPKVLPYILEVRPIMARFFPIHPFAGTLHAWYTLLPFIIPFQTSFYDRPLFQRVFGFHYNWYEYFVFISPVAFLLLVTLKRSFVKEKIQILLLIFIVGSMYVALGYPYSPFYWLLRAVPALQAFRVPQRALLVLTPVVIAILTICANIWQTTKKSYRSRLSLACIYIVSVGWTFIVSERILVRTYESPRVREAAIARELRSRDPGSYYVADFLCCIQLYLMKEKIPNLNYYYAWKPKGVISFLNSSGEGFNFSILKSVRPKYIIAAYGSDFSRYSYSLFFEMTFGSVWKTDQPTISPSFSLSRQH